MALRRRSTSQKTASKVRNGKPENIPPVPSRMSSFSNFPAKILELDKITCLDCWENTSVESSHQDRTRRYGLICNSCLNKRKSEYTKQKNKAMPVWANREAIKKIYIEARRLSLETGIPHHVDHIIPLRSPLVCGLHIPENLQILTALDNTKKSNKLI
jgi:hypothetical protein